MGNKEDDLQAFINPIDSDKVAQNPGILPYAHHVGSGLIRPEDKGKIKGRAMAAMAEQTNKQLKQIYGQMQLLAQQASELKKRVEIAEKIYQSEIKFEPLIGHTYHLYKRADGSYILSMIGPESWGKKLPYQDFLATVLLLSDHTWEILEKNEDF